MVTAKEEHHAADNHEHTENRFAIVLKDVLDAFGLRSHDKRHGQQHVGDEFAEHEHQAVYDHLPLVRQFAVDITDSSDAGEERAGV